MDAIKNEVETPNKKTKIVATISDKNCSVEFLTKLYKNGLNVVRINTAHQQPEDSLKVINNVRQVSDKIAIMIDTKGPEVRTNAAHHEIDVTAGMIIYFKGKPGVDFGGDTVTVNYENFVNEIPENSMVLIDDGELQFKVVGKEDDRLICKALNNGVIKSRKSVNVPNVSLNLPALTPKDIEYIRFAAKHNVDFIAHSFVRNKDDLLAIKEILAEEKTKACRLISKIENQEGVDNITEILEYCHGIMIARGDLAVEIPRERIPAIQKRLVRQCIKRRKPVIIATQMLHSMMDNPSPTRAEVSDVANAVYDEADAIMLSGETAYGKYPVESIRTMCEIAMEVEKEFRPLSDIKPKVLNNKVSAYLCKSAVEAADRLEARAIVADTSTGRTIRNVAGFRSNIPVLALCYNPEVVRMLALSFGVEAYYLNKKEFTTDEFVERSLATLADHFNFVDEDHFVILSSNFGSREGASYVGVSSLKDLKKRVLIGNA